MYLLRSISFKRVEYKFIALAGGKMFLETVYDFTQLSGALNIESACSAIE